MVTLPRDQNNVSSAGVLSVEEVATFDTTEIVNGILTVTTREAPDVDRTFVTSAGVLTVVEGVGGFSSLRDAQGNYLTDAQGNRLLARTA